MNYHQRAKLQDYQKEIEKLEYESDDLRNSELPRIQFRLLDIDKELRELKIKEAELNLEIAKEG